MTIKFNRPRLGIHEACQMLQKDQWHLTRGTIAMFGNEQFGQILFIRIVVPLVGVV